MLGAFLSRAKNKTVLVIPLLFVLLSAGAYFINPDWAFMFFVDSRKFPLWGVISIFASYFAIFFLAYYIGKKTKRENLILMMSFISLAFIIIFILTFDRAFFWGNYLSFLGLQNKGFLYLIFNFFGSKIGKFVLAGGVIFSIISLAILIKDEGIKFFISPDKK